MKGRKNYPLVHITVEDIKELLKKPVYGIPVYIAVDRYGRAYVYPLAHTEVT